MNQGERPLGFSMYKDDLATGSLGGAIGGVELSQPQSYWRRGFYMAFGRHGLGGAGLVCGAIGGTGAFVVIYLLHAL